MNLIPFFFFLPLSCARWCAWCPARTSSTNRPCWTSASGRVASDWHRLAHSSRSTWTRRAKYTTSSSKKGTLTKFNRSERECTPGRAETLHTGSVNPDIQIFMRITDKDVHVSCFYSVPLVFLYRKMQVMFCKVLFKKYVILWLYKSKYYIYIWSFCFF